MTNIALITGITGQDGSYLCELLLRKNYVVHGLVRRTSSTVRHRLDHLTSDPAIYNQKFFLHYADLDDVTTVRRVFLRVRPTEVYHLAGQSHVGISFDIPESTCEFTAMGTLRLLEILRDLDPVPKLLHASSSEIFGKPTVSPQDESTEIRPCNPYGIAKAFATELVRVYREAFGMFACNAICYNHESPRRGESFVTRKITKAVVAIKRGEQSELNLGDLASQRDWGYAPDYVWGMWQILQQSMATDYVLATGLLTSVREFLEAAFGELGLDWQNYVKTDSRLLRPINSDPLVGDASKARAAFGWNPTTKMPELARLMVRAEMAGDT
jgi:GDPmannose 4,6-dehydratase